MDIEKPLHTSYIGRGLMEVDMSLHSQKLPREFDTIKAPQKDRIPTVIANEG